MSADNELIATLQEQNRELKEALQNMRLLSIDWDFFLPDSFPYDWGHGETNSIFYEIIWGMRANNRPIKGGPRAMDAYVHDQSMLKDFWGKAIIGSPAMVFASDSHLDAYRVLADMLGSRNVEVTNLDAHHDCGYQHKVKDKPDCGNWLQRLGKRVKNATQVYPAWRRESPEGEPRLKLAFPREVRYWPDMAPVKADIVFVCRSSPWTPPWSDQAWLSFLEAAKGLGGLYTGAPYIEKARPFSPIPDVAFDRVKGWQVGAVSSADFAV